MVIVKKQTLSLGLAIETKTNNKSTFDLRDSLL